ncbi:hypothetical protein RHGRI_003080 [Rhododendron griersonianum]|uniref:Putative GTP diphosphokinase RSH1, chloroplastic n=1 Tax=Rhododendron griersonianum TaxID=479676 RepID=A0AAV6LTQ6_9ERIC|nr:hypothetical protein RHGRI_003080 [Rhododendron griersonianum]
MIGMACAPSMSVSVECVNVCKFSIGDGSGRYDCSALSCAWKAPRALTGFLASTAHSPQCSVSPNRRTGRRNRFKSRCEASHVGSWYCTEASEFVLPGRLLRSSLVHVGCGKWRICCSSPSSSASYEEFSPEKLWEDLKQTISYLPAKELELVRKALNLAFEAHDGQKRRSGEPFIIHPVEVARILGDLEVDWESIAAGLLHDTVEDTNVVTFERIEKEFGPIVRRIVEGETKVSKLGKLKCESENDSVQDVKADDLRQMFLAMTEEVRVIIVKLADRLHNMRTLSHMPQHKQVVNVDLASIAKETLQVFAPLAKLLGMYQIKSELENLSFMYTNAQEYAKVKSRVAELYKEHEKELVEANKILMEKIEDDRFLDLVSVKTAVRSACKEPYSIYRAVHKSDGSISKVNQVAQLRIIIKPKPCVGVGPLCSAQQVCYHVLGLLHGIWTPIPQSMKDYIATPKPNGYQSLHTTVIPFLYESMFQLEVQVCFEIPDFLSLQIGWLNAIREWQEEFVGNMSSREFVDTITRDLLGSRVFVFTPKGEIKNLPKGATAIDYAYMIHTEIGNKMVAAKVNGIRVCPSHVLANAEVVEIISYDFLMEQAALSATEITEDRVNEFVTDPKEDSKVEGLSDYSKGSSYNWEKIVRNVVETSKDTFPLQRGSIQDPKVNGKHNKHMQHVSLKATGEVLFQGNGVGEMILANIPMYKEVLPSLNRWQADKVASWHNLEGHSIHWFCVVCIDRTGMMAKITTALAAVGITICACAAEMDRGRGLAVMLFHIDGSLDCLVNVCSEVDLMNGVLGWSMGCSWPESQQFLEC